MNINRRGLTTKQIFLGFTLLETLVIVVVVGVLASLATVSLSSARGRALDIKRLSEIRQLQNALDRYLNEYDFYPTDNQIIPGQPFLSSDGFKTYMAKVPMNPKSRSGGGCPDKEYVYRQGTEGKTYNINYCLIQGFADLVADNCVALPGLLCVQNDICSCEDNLKPCCGYCAVGSTCLP
ncbi:hypothetical protein COT94_03100 [Candidatus Falkowbacteria bacterium CG10_big_fil_rev_8_21_14_0_10_37_14]|uniref:Type II secretion system protein GspG C-terminal domain-containing protein n=1 Tax=Candidatus Falkowbacteria bacterium CG10_big_fil_rev_8_21_14_0_10_37_14 TaxID=1974561 RepID=A0A2M6WT38_9BACT|nr:hypothetical protein [Candidatus Falkowbacteria bacterium]PIT95948.1 MAG: hypothetical protein COT94_03100 [Candidatus Falkowbacteria bacterium CG10_big_fil_rev_8_21_14_0_10_37_14]